VNKRVFDAVVAALGLALLSPLLLALSAGIFLWDFRSPFYIAPRIGKGGKPFPMVKFRSMVVNADRSGVSSTSDDDRRITPIGRWVRRFKLDELLQLVNVLLGQMSLVGPRPNVESGTQRYSPSERRLLDVLPGVTDFASIVFADEGAILGGSTDPDGDYDRLIRPWKSRLGLFYIDQRSMLLDASLMIATALALFSRRLALDWVACELAQRGAPQILVDVARREGPLEPSAPPQ
jgi:lipopolysaccharide/colanic/teichoic acid biosynthesis glycosyltransferase